MKKFAVIVRPESTGGYWGEVPEFPGCYSQAETKEELFDNLREAIAGSLELYEAPPRSANWLGSMAGTGQIVGDIVSPLFPEFD